MSETSFLPYAKVKMGELGAACGWDKEATMKAAFALMETDDRFRQGCLEAGLALSIDAAVAVKH